MEHEPKKSSWHQRLQNMLLHASQSNKISMVMYGIGILLIAIVIFQTGMLVGSRKDSLIHEQNERYLNLTAPLPTAHGTAGKIISLTLPTLLVADEDHTEKTILVRDETIIRSLRASLLPSELALDDYVVVIGTPTTKGYIQANLIRVLPKD